MQESNSKKNKIEWGTPRRTFQAIEEKLGITFDLDVCATTENYKCNNYISPQADALSLRWGCNRCWMNPPYGRAIGKWIEKAVEESKRGSTVYCLLPSRTDTEYWQNLVMKNAHAVYFIKGRIKFQGAKEGAMFPSAVVVFKPRGWLHRGPSFKTLEIPLEDK